MVKAQRTADAVQLAVHDTGRGIDPGFLPYVFERFSQADGARSGRGSGLGLAIARSLTNLHGGKMRLRSKLGTGTVVRITLPRDPAKANAKLSVAA